jgi:DHA1 family bicyclomycin/chloramphenicol resistance-like MFS transporter
MVRDVYSGPELARALALMTIIFAIAPGFSPLLGGLLQDAIGWRAVFGAALLVGIILFASALVFAPETLHKRSDPISLASVTHAYGQLLRDKEFMSFSLATAFIIGAMSAFFVGSPTVFIERLGVSATEYGFYPPLAITGFIIGGLVTRRLTERLDVHSLAKAGVFVSLIGAFLMVCFPSIGIQHKHAINVSIIIFVSGMGIFMPTAVALALERFSDRAASASAILGFLQMSVGAVTSAITGFLATQVPYLAFPSVMLVSALFAAALISTQTHPRSLPFGQ